MHPCDEAPVCVFAFLCKGCGKLCLSAATHTHQNRALPRWIGNQCFQLSVHATIDKTVSRYCIRSATENDGTDGRGRLPLEKVNDRLMIVVNLVEPGVRPLFKTCYLICQVRETMQ